MKIRPLVHEYVASLSSCLPCQCEESLFHALVNLRRGLHELDTELIREFAALLFSDGAFVCSIRLIADENLVHALSCVLLDVCVPCADIYHVVV